ncbi:50S ribosomal protein L29 [Myxococcota bacterium]|jgi:large subunit ribosomal protein L29|nr:50S ribosomal protein L29 [Myxococcota bacterium]
MNPTELREKSVDELNALDAEFRRRLFDLRFKHYTGQLVNTADLKATRRGIARIQTIIRERAKLQGAAD